DARSPRSQRPGLFAASAWYAPTRWPRPSLLHAHGRWRARVARLKDDHRQHLARPDPAAERTCMTSGSDMRATPLPPLWAQSLLSAVLPRATEESVSGDLLEEYCDAILPARGKRRADLWYLRQIAGFLWRATWMFIVLYAALLIVRGLADVFAP